MLVKLTPDDVDGRVAWARRGSAIDMTIGATRNLHSISETKLTM